MSGKGGQRYSSEFRAEMVGLVRAGRSQESLGREFESSAQTIRNWVKQADLDEGLRSDGLTTKARRELKREVKQLRMERDILKNAAAWFAMEGGSIPKKSMHSRRRTGPSSHFEPCAGCWVSPPAGTAIGSGGGLRRESGGAKAAPELVARDFSADGSDRLWVADIMYVSTLAGWLYLAVVVDASGRGLVDGEADADPAGQGRTDDGGQAPPAEARAGPPLGPGFAVHVGRVRRALPQRWDPAVDGLGRRRPGQRTLRELLRDPRDRADQPGALRDAG